MLLGIFLLTVECMYGSQNQIVTEFSLVFCFRHEFCIETFDCFFEVVGIILGRKVEEVMVGDMVRVVGILRYQDYFVLKE